MKQTSKKNITRVIKIKNKLTVAREEEESGMIGCWEPPCLVSEAVTPMAKAESETLGP